MARENKGRNLLDFLTDSDIEFVAITVKHYEDRWLWENTAESERDGDKPGLNFGDEIGRAAFGVMKINQAGRVFGSKARSNWHTLRTSTYLLACDEEALDEILSRVQGRAFRSSHSCCFQ